MRGKLIGKIILANFLEYRLNKFIAFIKGVERQPVYEKLTRKAIIIRRRLSDAKILREKKNGSATSGDGVIAKIKKGSNLSIYYTNEEFSIEYTIDEEKLRRIDDLNLTKEEKKNISGLLHKLRRINTRNLMMHEVLKGIVECQRDYFESNNDHKSDLKLKPVTGKELAKTISNKKSIHSQDFVIDTSRISRIIKGISVITPQGKVVSLKSLFPTKRDIVKSYIKVLLNAEKEEIYDNRLKMPYTDEQLSIKLNDEYSLSITKREVAYCRKDTGILPYSKRNGYVYYSLLRDFSKTYHFTVSSVMNNAPAGSGVYELCLRDDRIGYPLRYSQIFYIGSGKSLRKRLLAHLSKSTKNGGIKRFVIKSHCVFRYIQVPKRWIREEKNLYDLFVTTFGASPVCNHVSPKASRK